MPLLLVKETLPPFIVHFGVPSHRVGLLKVQLISNLEKELVDRFLENHINPLLHPVL